MFILLGLPGSGKSVQANLFNERNHIHHIAPGISLRKIAEIGNNKELQELLKNGSLVDDKMVASIIDESIKNTNGESFIIEGYPRTMDQIVKYKNILQKDGKFFIKKVFVLDITPETIMERLTTRKVCGQCHKSFQKDSVDCDKCEISLTTRSDDTPEAILKRLTVQGEHLKDILKYLENEGMEIVFIKGNQPIEQVYSELNSHIEKLL